MIVTYFTLHCYLKSTWRTFNESDTAEKSNSYWFNAKRIQIMGRISKC